MFSKPLLGSWFLLFTTGLLSGGPLLATAQTQSSIDSTNLQINASGTQTGTMYSQPIVPDGRLLLSSLRDPDGSDFDQYVWDDFTLQADRKITGIKWFGVYDPSRLGAGGPVLDFGVSIYPSIAVGTEPHVADPPLVEYQTGGNAGETSIGSVGGHTVYAYIFSLPTPFAAAAGVKYWVQIEAIQHGSTPDWCMAAGSGGNGRHYLRGAGAGGDTMYRSVPGDAAFSLLGPISDMDAASAP